MTDKPAFRFSGEAARSYEEYLGPFMFEPSALEMARRVQAIPARQMLELACGSGRLTRHLAGHLTGHSTLHATDISPDMLDMAREKIKHPNLTYSLCDIRELPFPNNTFDLVVCQYGMMFLPDRQAGFREVFRVLKPGGTFLFSTWDKTENSPVLKLLWNEILLPFFQAEDPSRFLLPFSMHDAEGLKQYLLEAGFSMAKVEHLRLHARTAKPADLVNGFLLNHALAAEVSEKDPLALHRLAEELELKIRQRFGNDPVQCELSAYITSGVKI